MFKRRATRIPVQHSNSESTIIMPFFYVNGIGKVTCHVERLDLELTVTLLNPQPPDRPGAQLMIASVAGSYIGGCEIYGSNIKIRINDHTNTFEILVNDEPVTVSNAPAIRLR